MRDPPPPGSVDDILIVKIILQLLSTNDCEENFWKPGQFCNNYIHVLTIISSLKERFIFFVIFNCCLSFQGFIENKQNFMILVVVKWITDDIISKQNENDMLLDVNKQMQVKCKLIYSNI
jgi:hypothetical protein